MVQQGSELRIPSALELLGSAQLGHSFLFVTSEVRPPIDGFGHSRPSAATSWYSPILPTIERPRFFYVCFYLVSGAPFLTGLPSAHALERWQMRATRKYLVEEDVEARAEGGDSMDKMNFHR